MFWTITGLVLLVVIVAAWLWDRTHDGGHTRRDVEDARRVHTDADVRWIKGGGMGT